MLFSIHKDRIADLSDNNSIHCNSLTLHQESIEAPLSRNILASILWTLESVQTVQVSSNRTFQPELICCACIVKMFSSCRNSLTLECVHAEPIVEYIIPVFCRLLQCIFGLSQGREHKNTLSSTFYQKGAQRYQKLMA